MESIEKAIEAKLKLLEFTSEQGHEAAETGDLTQLERKRKTLETKVEEIHELKVKAQELKFEQGDEVDAIRQWSAQLEERLAVYEKAIVDLSLASKSARDSRNPKDQRARAKISSYFEGGKVRRRNEVRETEARAKAKLRKAN